MSKMHMVNLYENDFVSLACSTTGDNIEVTVIPADVDCELCKKSKIFIERAIVVDHIEEKQNLEQFVLKCAELARNHTVAFREANKKDSNV